MINPHVRTLMVSKNFRIEGTNAPRSKPSYRLVRIKDNEEILSSGSVKKIVHVFNKVGRR